MGDHRTVGKDWDRPRSNLVILDEIQMLHGADDVVRLHAGHFCQFVDCDWV